MSVKKRFLGNDGLDAFSQTIINVAEPVNNSDAATKQYADAIASSSKNRANHTGTQDIDTVVNLQSSLDSKVDKVVGKALSENDFTTTLKNKLDGLANYTHPNSGVTAGTYTKVTVNIQGHITTGASLAETDIPNLSWSKIVTGKPTTLSGYGISDAIPASQKGVANGVATLDAAGTIPSAQLPSFVDDVLEYATKSAFPATGETGKIYIDLATNKTWRWGGSVYVEITASPGSTDSVPEGSLNLYFTNARAQAAVSTITGNAATATKLQTPRSIAISGDGTGSVNFDGSANVSIPLTLGASGVGAGTYKSVTVNAKGIVTGGTNPTTLSGHGITDGLNTTANVNVPLTNGSLSSAALTTTTTTANQILDSFPSSTFRTAKYVIQATAASSYHTCEVLIIHNGSTVYLVQYGDMFTSASLFTVDADVNVGNVRLQVTPTNASTVFKAIRQAISV